MNEINNNNNNINVRNIKFTSGNVPQETGKVDGQAQKQFDVQEYTKAAAADGPEAAGRAMVIGAQKADNTENDVTAILSNQQLLNDSEALFNAAMKAGYSYPVAASFATSELR